jgi:hypothetical protein
MPDAKRNSIARKGLYARLPARSYRKIRRMARLPPVAVEGDRKGLLLRMSPDLHEKLRRLALARSTSSGKTVGMQSILADLIDRADVPKKRPKRSMARVADELIKLARLPRAARP